MTRRVDVFARG